MYKDAKDVGGAPQVPLCRKVAGFLGQLSHDDKAIQACKMSHASSPSSPCSCLVGRHQSITPHWSRTPDILQKRPSASGNVCMDEIELLYTIEAASKLSHALHPG
jgi:hypothetical protein